MPINVERGPARSDGKGRIRITVFIGGVLKRHRLEIHVKENCWDTVHKRVKIGDPMHAVYNKAIEKALEQARTVELEHPEWTAEQLIAALATKPNASRTFYEIARERLDILSVKLGYHTVRQRKSALGHIERLRPGLVVSDFTPTLLRELEVALLAEGLGRNTVTGKLKRLRTMWLDAAEAVGCEMTSPWSKVRLKTKPTMIRGLMPDDVERIRLLDLSKLPPIVQLARDAFILQYYLCGMRWGDLCRLHTGHFQDGHLHYQMNKSAHVIHWPVHPHAREIMGRWKGVYTSVYTYVLPLLRSQDVSEVQVSKRIDRMNQEVNHALKVVSALAGTPKLTTHWARHSNSVKAILADVNNRELQDLMGHASSRTTDEYAKALRGNLQGSAFKKMHG